MEASENNFWTEPPWGAGEKKYRLGLRPIELGEWLNRKIGENLLKHKKNNDHPVLHQIYRNYYYA